MTQPKPFDREKTIEAFMKVRFGPLLTWQKPDFHQSIGPYFPSAFDEFTEILRHTIEVVRLYYEKQETDLLMLMNRSDINRFPKARMALRYYSDEIKSLRDQTPEWYSGGFGVSEYEADYDYWLKMKSWSLSEATALSLGFEPSNEISKSVGRNTCDPTIIEFYERRKNLISNTHYLFGEQTMLPPKVEVIAEWFVTKNIPISTNFLDALLAKTRRKIALRNSRLGASEPSIKPDQREIVSLQKLALGMAIKGYLYDPDKSKNHAITDIKSDLDLLGLSLDTDTIRKHLRAGVQFLPEEWKDE